ncbi:MAG TPA: hypothetical protein VGP26_23350 [Actinophytocola sp.]|nr:hypothetical protein [Actinophytocola sp.]
MWAALARIPSTVSPGHKETRTVTTRMLRVPDRDTGRGRLGGDGRDPDFEDASHHSTPELDRHLLRRIAVRHL